MDRLNKRSFMPHSRLSLISRCAREIWEARRDVWECFMKKWRVDTFKGSQAQCIFYLYHRGLLHSGVKCLRCVTTITLSFTAHTFQCWCGIVTHLGIMPTTQDETYKSWSWYKYRPLLTELITRQELSSSNVWTESGHGVASGRTTSRWWALNMPSRGPVLTLSSA